MTEEFAVNRSVLYDPDAVGALKRLNPKIRWLRNVPQLNLLNDSFQSRDIISIFTTIPQYISTIILRKVSVS